MDSMDRARVMRKSASRSILVLLLLSLGACGGDGTSATSPATEPTPPGPAPSRPGECAVTYDGTFAAIQDVIFARHGCTADACHGSARSGGLDLRPDAAYANLIEVTATGSAPAAGRSRRQRSELPLAEARGQDASRHRPGRRLADADRRRPTLERGRARARAPAGSRAARPRPGRSSRPRSLVDGCLPRPEPVTIQPLTPPPAGRGRAARHAVLRPARGIGARGLLRAATTT